MLSVPAILGQGFDTEVFVRGPAALVIAPAF